MMKVQPTKFTISSDFYLQKEIYLHDHIMRVHTDVTIDYGDQ